MPFIHIETPDGHSTAVEVADGHTVLDACRKAQLPLEGLCGGELACSTCHVQVLPPWPDLLEPPTEAEEDMLDLLPDIRPGSRLGCRIRADARNSGLCVRLIAVAAAMP